MELVLGPLGAVRGGTAVSCREENETDCRLGLITWGAATGLRQSVSSPLSFSWRSGLPEADEWLFWIFHCVAHLWWLQQPHVAEGALAWTP